MEKFLRERGIQESLIEKIQEDGIDANVVTLMKDDELKNYLPRYGDRIAVVAFAKQELCKNKSLTSDRKLSLREKLIAKLQNKQGPTEHMKRSVAQTGNANAKRRRKKIELGWLHTYGINGALKQVRTPSGGGTRTIDVSVDCVIGEVLPVAKDLFFPGGISNKGTVDDFEFYIADQTQAKLPLTLTLKELLESTKLKHTRLYMVTSPLGDIMISNDTETTRNTKPAGNGKHDGTAEAPGGSSMNVNSRTAEAPGGSGMNVNSRTAEAPGGSGMNDDSGTEEATGGSCKHVDSVTAETGGGSNKNVETAGDETHLADKQEETSSNGSLISANISEPGEIMIQGNGAQYQFQDSTVSDDYSMEHSPVTFPEEENDYLQDFLRRSEELESNPPPTAYITPDIIRIHRTVILNELIPVFKDPVITDKHLQFIFVNEKGHDSQGLSRDVYAAFWEAFYLKYTDGEDFRIPVLSNELGDTEWEAVGRILLKGYMDLKYFPVRIAPAFFVAVCHGENAVTPEILKNSFLSFLSSTEKDLLEHALSGAEYDSNELIELLDRFECRCLPQKDNLLSLILQIAHRVLIQEPKYAMDALQRVGQRIWRAEFSAVNLILQMYEQSEPTVRKVLALFSANPVSKDQNDSFKYLQKFVRGCNKEQLRHLLRFLTGSDMLCVSNIDVSFVVRCGAGRVPTAHTCGPVLELPSTYISYPDFRNEWESILQAKENMDMMIA